MTKWTFSSYYGGFKATSPRLFDTKEEAIQAIVEKLTQHALDNEFPSIGLVAIVERCNVQPD
jgi:hypothetical protein